MAQFPIFLAVVAALSAGGGCLAQAAPKPARVAKKTTGLPTPHWVMFSADDRTVARILVEPEFSSPVSAKEKRRAARIFGEANTVFVEGLYWPVGPQDTAALDVKSVCGVDPRCRTLVGLINQSRTVFECPAVEYPGISILPFPGMRQLGIDRTCVETRVTEARLSAEHLLPDDPARPWVIQALGAVSRCQSPELAGDASRCATFDLSVRESFFTDLVLGILRTPPDPATWVTSNIRFNDGTPAVSSNPPGAGAPRYLSGEFEINRVDPRLYPGRIVVREPGRAMAYWAENVVSFPDFARQQARGKCSGSLLDARIGLLDLGAEVKVFFLAQCGPSPA